MRRDVRLSCAVEEYLRQRKARGKAASTVTNEGFVLRRFVAWYGDLQLRHMRPEKVAAWFYGDGGLRSQHLTRDGRQRSPIAASTHNYYRTRLASFFRFATQHGWLRTDLLRDVDPLPMHTALRHRPTPLLLNQMIETAGSDRDQALLRTLVHTALRKSEAMALRVGDVDLVEFWLRVTISKSHLDDRLPLTQELHAALGAWLRSYAGRVGRPLRPDDYLFPTRKAGRFRWRTAADGTRVRFMAPEIWDPSRPMHKPEKVVQAALARIGLPTKGEGCHTLRRASARALFDQLTQDKGYDSALRVVSAFLHHKSSTTTELYLGLDAERERRDEWLRGRPFLSTATGGRVVAFAERPQTG